MIQCPDSKVLKKKSAYIPSKHKGYRVHVEILHTSGSDKKLNPCNSVCLLSVNLFFFAGQFLFSMSALLAKMLILIKPTKSGGISIAHMQERKNRRCIIYISISICKNKTGYSTSIFLSASFQRTVVFQNKKMLGLRIVLQM